MVETIKDLKPKDNGEILLTDIVKAMKDKKLKIGALIVEDNTEILGVNDRVQLELLSRVLKFLLLTLLLHLLDFLLQFLILHQHHF